MARFRFHRGSLADSKATEIEVNSLQELEEFVNHHSDSVFKISNLKCEYYGYDNRPGGYPMTHIVTCEYAHMTGRYPLGFSDSLLTYGIMERIIKIPLVTPTKRKWEITDPCGSLKESLRKAKQILIKKDESQKS